MLSTAHSVRFVPVDLVSDRAAFIAHATDNRWPFHVTAQPTAEQVAKRIDSGGYDDDDHAAFWIDVDGDRIGTVVLEDLSDDAPLFDLRLAERHRGRGLAGPVLRALTAFVFESYPEVDRFEGQTREDNRVMRRVFRSAGFVKEAHYRDGWPVEGAAPVASVAYAILRRDWVSGETTPVPWDDDADILAV